MGERRGGFANSAFTLFAGYTWYLKLVDETVKKALQETGAEQVKCGGGEVWGRSR